MAEAGISLGSNLGDKAGAVEAALRALEAEDGISVVRRSRLYRTEPWGDADQDWFVNACALVHTRLPPRALLDRCLAVELALGRDRASGRRWGPRAIDLDILFYDDVAVSEPSLTLPHPHLFERAFVLVPLAEIAPDRIISGRKVADALSTVDRSGVVVWDQETK